MNPAWIEQLWSSIRQEWHAIPEEVRPWGVWIARYAPLATETQGPTLQTMPLLQAWFLDEGMNQPQERSAWAFARFWLMHFKRPWDVAECASRDPRYAARCYPLGVVAFASYADTQDLCLETMWGGLWGLGRRLTLTPEGLIERSQFLWIA